MYSDNTIVRLGLPVPGGSGPSVDVGRVDCRLKVIPITPTVIAMMNTQPAVARCVTAPRAKG